MGLDQYLHATKTFEPTDPQALAAMAAAETDFAALEILAKVDPHEDEPYLYLGQWEFQKGSDEYTRAGLMIEAAGMTELVTPDSGGRTIGVLDGKVFVQTTAVYWRKTNSVHNWFVQNCQDGTDDCGEYPVHPEQLAALRSACAAALAAHANGDIAAARDAMTPAEGFFFGSTEIDDWWVQDLTNTVSELERAINAAIAAGGVTFSYHSSW